MTRDIVESPRFTRPSRKFIHRNVWRKKCVKETLLRMSTDVFDPKLKTHALTGNLAGRYASSCGYDCRIVFELVKNPSKKIEFILLHDVGTHDEVY